MGKRVYQPGARLGAYEIVGLLGYGGMGIVYEARAGETSVALKVVSLEEQTHTAREIFAHDAQRIRREFSALLPLDHPNIVRVYAFGWTEAGEPYFAMERVSGTALDTWLAQRHPPEEAVRVFTGIARGLAELHRLELVHRDLKPSNVLLREDGTPVLIDFGIVLSPVVPTLTLTRGWVGTLRYSAPELAVRVLNESRVGEAVPYSPAYDVHALGVMLYQALTHRFPFDSPGNDALGLLVLGAVLQQEPRHPSDVAPEVPRALGDFVLRMLHKDPSRRPRDGAEVVAALEALAAGTPVAPERRRPRVRDVLTGVAAALAMLGLALIVFMHRRPVIPISKAASGVDAPVASAQPAENREMTPTPQFKPPDPPSAPAVASAPRKRLSSSRVTSALHVTTSACAVLLGACSGAQVRPDGTPSICPRPREGARKLGVPAGFEVRVTFLREDLPLIKYGTSPEGDPRYLLPPEGAPIVMSFTEDAMNPYVEGFVKAPFPLDSRVYGVLHKVDAEKKRYDFVFTRLVLPDGREYPLCAVAYDSHEKWHGKRGFDIPSLPPYPPPGRYIIGSFGFYLHVLEPF